KTDILSKPLNKDEKTALRDKLQLPTDGKIAVAVGRFIPLKRYDVLIELWKDMPENNYLLLIGGGSEKQKYEEIIARHNLKKVIIEDFHKFDELLNYFRAADIFVHPTTYDVWGLVINEAMASGLPVVVSDTCVAGRELIVNGENGYLVKLYDDNNFIERVKEFLSNESLTEKAAAKAINTIKDFTVENMVTAQIENVEKILSKNAG
ncbi:MAG: glycosyltransferase family 4 protein, partial [Clostridia bacterium]|nr:glycosyltransferase family 4 protein [Clostridia bacterium]